MRPTALLYLAALLIFALGAAHSVLGERYILIRLFRRDNLPTLFGATTFTTRTLRFAWHLTTVTWWGIAALIVLLARGQAGATNVATVLGWTSLVSALVAMVVSRGRHLSWLVLLVVGCIVLVWGPAS